MKQKVYHYMLLLAVIVLGIYIGKPLITSANASKTMQVDKMILEFTNKDTVILKKILDKSNNALNTITYDDIKKIIVAEGITALPDGMFEWFPNVETIELPSTLKDFDSGRYYDASYDWNFREYYFEGPLLKLVSITVSSKSKYFKSIDGVLYSKDGKKIIYYPEEKKTTTFVIPDIMEQIYISNKYIKVITLGANVDDFSLGLPSLTTIKVSSKNKLYTAVDGVLFNKDKTELLLYPDSKGEKYKVPIGTKKIDSGAFSNSNITKIILPEGLKSIGHWAFSNTNVKVITIPKSLTVFNKLAFEGSRVAYMYVDKQNAKLSSKDGIVYNKDQSLMIYWPEGRIEENLRFVETLATLDLSMVKTIGESKSIHIPKALTSITNTQNNKISNITIAEGNSSFLLNQGILYSSDLKSIQLYPNQNPITEIVLPESVEYFDWKMFLNENTTTSITLSKFLKEFRQVHWYDWRVTKYFGFTHLTEVKLPEENAYFTMKDGVLYSKDMSVIEWFPQNSPLSIYTMPETVKSMRQGQLMNAANLVELNINANFTMDELMEGINNEFTYIEYLFGTYCPKLEKINVDVSNTVFASKDGVLYEKGGSFLLLYPSAKKDKVFTVPDGVNSMNAITYNPYLEEIILSKNILGLNYNLSEGVYNPFSYFTALKKISVVKENYYYFSLDGVLYAKKSNFFSRDGVYLIAYPIAKTDATLKLQANIGDIVCDKSIRYAKHLKEITITDHQYLITKEGSLYTYDGVLFIAPGSGMEELDDYVNNLLSINGVVVSNE